METFVTSEYIISCQKNDIFISIKVIQKSDKTEFMGVYADDYLNHDKLNNVWKTITRCLHYQLAVISTDPCNSRLIIWFDTIIIYAKKSEIDM